MIHCAVADLYTNRNILLWCVLSFKAGLINAAGFLITGSFVSHVTGFGTQVGIAIAHEEHVFGMELLVIPIAFILGGVITSLILDINYDEKKIPNYPVVQFIITIVLGFTIMLFEFNFFGDVALPMMHNENTIVLIGLLCLVCGLKNSLTTWATHGKIRTTHLTGLSTDIGLHLPKIFWRQMYKSRYPESRKVTYVRLLTFAAFALGSLFSAYLVPQMGYKMLSIAFYISVLILVICIFHRNSVINQTTKSEVKDYANIN